MKILGTKIVKHVDNDNALSHILKLELGLLSVNLFKRVCV